MEINSLPSRGQTGKPGSPDAKVELTKFKKNQRSANSIRSRRKKRQILRCRGRMLHLSAKRELRNRFPAEIKFKLASLRKDRRSSALDRLSNVLSGTKEKTPITADTPLLIEAPRDLEPLELLKIKKFNRPLLSPRRFQFIATFNCRTLTAIWRRYELVNYCIINHIMILAVQEHRIHFEPTSGDFFRREHLGNGWWFIYSSASPTAVGGVGFLFSPAAFKDLCGLQFISPRIVSVKLGNHSDFKACIYSVYSPTSGSDLDMVSLFYDELSTSLEDIPLSWLTIIMGDFNASVMSSASAPFSVNQKENRNTPPFEDFLLQSGFKAVNTLFQKRRARLLTFYGPKKRRVTLDYILLRPKWIKSATDCTVKSPLAIASDHNLLKLKIKWKLKNNRMKATRRFNYAILRIKSEDDIPALEINTQITDHIIANCSIDQAQPLNVNYDCLSVAIKDSLNAYLPCLPSLRKRQPWVGVDLQNLRYQYIQSRVRFRDLRSKASKDAMSTLAQSLSTLYSVQQQQYLNSICDEIDSLAGEGKSKLAWTAINKLTGRKSRSSGIITAVDSADRLSKWHDHFKNLLSPETPPVRSNLNLPKAFNGLPFRTGPITSEELQSGLTSLSCDKACGEDELVNEVLRKEELSTILLEVLNICYSTKTVPDAWHLSLLIPVFKKGDPSLCNNYRGIALMSVFAKLYNRLLLGRIRNGLDGHLRENQNGFRPLRSTGQHVLAWRRIYEEITATKDAKMISTFVDFSKAFDSVDWNYIENILISYDVPTEIVDAVMSVYYGAKAAVKFEGGISDSFDLGVGVLQGDTLAPYLFVIVIDWVLRNAITDATKGICIKARTGSRTRQFSPALYVTDLDFADDIALLSSDSNSMQQMLLSVESWALKVGLRINAPKTEFMLSGTWGAAAADITLHLASGIPIAKVEDFKYLGTWLLSSSRDFKTKRAQAWVAAKRLNKLWRSTILSDSLKLRLFNSLVVSILLYNATTWTVNKTLMNSLDGGYNRLLRYALNIRWMVGVRSMTNQAIQEKYNLQPISEVLRHRRLVFAGHCYRCRDSAPQPIMDVLFLRYPGTRNKGNRSNYRMILSDETQLEETQLQEAMLDRKRWRRLVNR